MSRVYDSGDDFERYFTTADASEAEKAMFNGNVGSSSQPASSQFDVLSPQMVGTKPTQKGVLFCFVYYIISIT